MPAWALWIIAACLLGVGEMLTLSFFLAPFAVGAAAAALADVLGAGTVVSFAVFLVSSILLLLVLRPLAYQGLRAGADRGGRRSSSASPTTRRSDACA